MSDTINKPEQKMDTKISRREALKKLSIGTIGFTSLFSPLISKVQASQNSRHTGKKEPAGRPNILFIMTDDHAVSALSCYGSRLINTPNLDRIANEGMLFNNCYVTNSLCAPSRATILTGKYSHKNGVMENLYGDKEPFDGNQQTFPKLLRKNGYSTAMIGKWHLKSEPTGFDYWNILPGQGRYNNPVTIEMGKKIKHDGYVTNFINDLTIETMERFRKKNQPFCIMSHHKATHRGWIPDKKHRDMFKDLDLPVPPTFNDDLMNRSSAATHAYNDIATMPDWRKEQPEGLTQKEKAHWNYQHYIKEYLRTVAAFDDALGDLLDYLDESGLAENTLLVYTTDNGMFIGEHGFFDKRFMFEESIQVPLMVRYPKEIRPGSSNNNMVLNLDFPETFLDYAGINIPDDMQGESFRPLLQEQEKVNWRESFYYHYYEYPGPHKVRPHYGTRNSNYKLIYYYTINEWELFDLTKDPFELNSVYDNPAYQKVVKEMTRDLRNKRKDLQDHTGKPIPDEI